MCFPVQVFFLSRSPVSLGIGRLGNFLDHNLYLGLSCRGGLRWYLLLVVLILNRLFDLLLGGLYCGRVRLLPRRIKLGGVVSSSSAPISLFSFALWSIRVATRLLLFERG